jgi:Salmonella virulence plasmid 65kDa B protein/Insecticide toxin TcdB middle/N-terminal region
MTHVCHKLSKKISSDHCNRWLTLGAGIALFACAVSFVTPSVAQNSGSPGQFQVTDAGAASYSIPLYSAPSAGGLDVKLSLQYSSQSPNGVLGVGWSLTGISAITRCPKTPAEEGDRIGVKNDATDVFCLDGQKLHAVSGTYGAPGSEYRTSIDSYSKIIANGSQGSGPQSFTVYTKSGAILEFGGTAESRLEHPGKANIVRVWMVSQMRDRFSTTANNNATAINFTYTKNTTLGEQLLQTVRHNNGQIKLIYEARPANDQILKYDDGIQLGSTNSRVSKIEIYDEPLVSGARQLRPFKEYRLAYIQSQATKRSLINSIQECQATPGTECLPAVTMSYRQFDPASFVDTRQGVLLGGFGSRPAAADFEGKGYSSIAAEGDIRLRIGLPNQSSMDESLQYLIWDIDGDAKSDIHYVRITGLLSDSTTRVEKIVYGNGTTYEKPVFGGDFSFIVQVHCYADTLGLGLSWGQSAPGCQGADLNGDGLADVVYAAGESIRTIQIDAWRPDYSRHDIVQFGFMNNNSASFNLGDVNGDGKTDILLWESFAGPLRLRLSNGLLNNTYPTYSVSLISALDVNNLGGGPVACIGDFYGDGRSRALIGKSGVATLTMLEFNGIGFTETPTNIPVHSYGYICADFDGDGRTDIHINQTGRIWQGTSPGPADVLTQVNNGLGYIQKIDYKSMTDNSVYTKGTGAASPVVDVQTPITVVSRVQSGNDAQGWNVTSYRYEGLRANLHRRGTLGFAKVVSRNEITDISVATTYLQEHPFTGMKSVVHKYRGSATSPQTLETSNYTYERRGYNGAAPTPLFSQVHLVQSETIKTDLSGAFLAREQEFIEQIDNFGNPQLIRSIQLDANGTPTSRKTTQLAYSNNASNWLIGLPTSNSTRQENLRSLPLTVAGGGTSAGAQPA